MKHTRIILAAVAAIAAASQACAQTVTLPQVRNAGGANVPSTAAVLIDPSGIAISATNPLATTMAAPSTAAIDRGAIVGTTAVTLMPANANRRGYAIQNQSTTASCYVSGLATATADYRSLIIGPGGYYDTPITHVGLGAISIICTAASTSVYAREW